MDRLRSRPGQVTALFRQFDLDGNGHIDLAEFKAGLRSNGCCLETYEFSYLFALIDEDGSGSIEPNEFANFLAAPPAVKLSRSKRILQRRNSQLYRLGLYHCEADDVFHRAVLDTTKDKEAIRRRNYLRKQGMRDFSDFKIVHAIASFRDGLVRLVRSFDGADAASPQGARGVRHPQ